MHNAVAVVLWIKGGEDADPIQHAQRGPGSGEGGVGNVMCSAQGGPPASSAVAAGREESND